MSERPDVETWARSAGDSLVRLAFVLTGDGDEAQDVVQTVLLRMMDARRTTITDPQAYARRAIANEVASRGRRRAVLRRITPRLAAGVATTARDTADGVVDREHLAQALGRLGPRPRTVLVLRYLEDLDDAAIGEALGCSPATVRSIAARALAKLRDHLTDPTDPTETDRWDR